MGRKRCCERVLLPLNSGFFCFSEYGRPFPFPHASSTVHPPSFLPRFSSPFVRTGARACRTQRMRHIFLFVASVVRVFFSFGVEVPPCYSPHATIAEEFHHLLSFLLSSTACAGQYYFLLLAHQHHHPYTNARILSQPARQQPVSARSSLCAGRVQRRIV